MSDSPPVSVVMPVFNAGHYLPEAIESVLAQTFESFEFVILDDGSTDGSAETIAEFANRDGRIKPVFGEHKGIVETLNSGFKLAAGKYIARMDADDVSLPDRFQLQHEFMEKHNVDSCGGHYIVIDGEGRYLFTHVVSTRPELTAAVLARTVPFAHGSAMIRRSFVEENNVVYRKVRNAEDYAFWIDCFEKGANIANVNTFIYMHRNVKDKETLARKAINKDAKLLSRSFVKSRHDLIFRQILTQRDAQARFNLYEQNCIADFLIRTLFWKNPFEKIRILYSIGKVLVLINLLRYLRLL